jgi:hypothetical protein
MPSRSHLGILSEPMLLAPDHSRVLVVCCLAAGALLPPRWVAAGVLLPLYKCLAEALLLLCFPPQSAPLGGRPAAVLLALVLGDLLVGVEVVPPVIVVGTMLRDLFDLRFPSTSSRAPARGHSASKSRARFNYGTSAAHASKVARARSMHRRRPSAVGDGPVDHQTLPTAAIRYHRAELLQRDSVPWQPEGSARVKI